MEPYIYIYIYAATILFQGGIAFVAIKGVLRIYFKQQQYVRQAQRRILDFTEPETSSTASQRAAPVPNNPEPPPAVPVDQGPVA